MARDPGAGRPASGTRRSGSRDLDAVVPVVYEELRKLAHSQLGRFRPGQTLDTTALVHEAYLKLANRSAEFRDRKHFFSVAAMAMRQIVIDYARRRMADKRGGGAPHVLLEEWDGSAIPVDAQANALLALDRALDRLSEFDERLARVVELRFFGGLSVRDAADVLDVSAVTIKRDTRAARAFLFREMSEGREAGL